MKNILFATTALVATAGIASADDNLNVAISGLAEIGVNDNGNGNLQYFQDIDVRFDMSGETDGGLGFTANIDLDQVPGGVGSSTTDGGGTIGVSGGFGNVTMGDTDGAFDWALTEVAMGGSMADNETSHTGYNGNNKFEGDSQVLRWDHTIGTMGVAVSMTQGDDGAGVEDDIVQAGVKYGMDMGGNAVNMGVSFADGGTGNDAVGISLSAGLGAVTARLNYSDGEIGGSDYNHMGIGLGWSQGPLTVGANYGEIERGTASTDGFGLAVNYGLGGGATFQIGYASDGAVSAANPNGDDHMSMGLSLSF